MQRVLEQEVGLEEGRLAALALRTKCRKLESESLFSEVFEKYEEEIRQLQVTLDSSLSTSAKMLPHNMYRLDLHSCDKMVSSLHCVMDGVPCMACYIINGSFQLCISPEDVRLLSVEKHSSSAVHGVIGLQQDICMHRFCHVIPLTSRRCCSKQCIAGFSSDAG